MAAGAGVAIFMIITVILLFVSMVLSAMASADAKKSPEECQQKCSKWAMWSALVAGIAFVIILGIMISLVLFRQRGYAAKKKAEAAVPSPEGEEGMFAGLDLPPID